MGVFLTLTIPGLTTSTVLAATPSSYSAWVEMFQPCAQPCFHKMYRKLISDSCGHVKASTESSDVHCICSAIFVYPDQHVRQGAYPAHDMGTCVSSHCGGHLHTAQFEAVVAKLYDMCVRSDHASGTFPLATALYPLMLTVIGSHGSGGTSSPFAQASTGTIVYTTMNNTPVTVSRTSPAMTRAGGVAPTNSSSAVQKNTNKSTGQGTATPAVPLPPPGQQGQFEWIRHF